MRRTPQKPLFRTSLALFLLLSLSGCGGLALLAVNAPARLGEHQVIRDLAYGEHGRQRLDVYVLPRDDAELRPLIVFLHGGRWRFGEKEQYAFAGAALAQRGFIAVLPNYRLYPEAKLPEFADDVARAVTWAHEHATGFGGDPRRLFVMGHSAGAHLAALIALDQHYLRDRGSDPGVLAGVIGVAGPYDFLPFTDDDIRDIFGLEDRYRLSQPIEFARGDAPPMLLLHGTTDDTVWIKNTRSLAAAIRKRGGRVDVRYYDGISHEEIVGSLSIPLRHKAPVLEDVNAFVAAR